MKRKCKGCGSSDGVREAIYGMPAYPLDEEKYFIAGCTKDGPKYICIICDWGKDQIKEWMPEGMDWLRSKNEE